MVDVLKCSSLVWQNDTKVPSQGLATGAKPLVAYFIMVDVLKCSSLVWQNYTKVPSQGLATGATP